MADNEDDGGVYCLMCGRSLCACPPRKRGLQLFDRLVLGYLVAIVVVVTVWTYWIQP